MPSQASLDLGPAGTGQAVEWDDTDLASLSLTARLRLTNANERLAGLSDLQRGERTLTDETLAAVLELQEATLLVQTISEASIAQLESARKAGRAEPTRDQGPGGRELERAVPRPGAATEPELQLPPVEAIAHSPESPSVPCAVCMANIAGEVIRAPCGHTWDVPCLWELFQRAMKDESLFPPTCCGRPVPLALVREHLGAELISLFLEKEREHKTRSRVYCAVPSCSIFLGPAADTPSRLFCHECRAKTTCAHCAGPAHSRSLHCASPDDAELAALAEREGWRRCRRCGHMVELAVGCNHMTCRCRFEFCYVCGAPWKTCGCPLWYQERLRAAAEDAAQWRPLAHGDMRVVDDVAEEEHEEGWEEQDEAGSGPEDIDREELEDDVAYHPPPVLDLDHPQPEDATSPAESRAGVGSWQVGHTASGFLAIVPAGLDHTEEEWQERLQLQASCRHDGDWVYVRVQDQHPHGPLVHPCWRCGRANVEVGVCRRCLTSRCRQCNLDGTF